MIQLLVASLNPDDVHVWVGGAYTYSVNSVNHSDTNQSLTCDSGVFRKCNNREKINSVQYVTMASWLSWNVPDPWKRKQPLMESWLSWNDENSVHRETTGSVKRTKNSTLFVRKYTPVLRRPSKRTWKTLKVSGVTCEFILRRGWACASAAAVSGPSSVMKTASGALRMKLRPCSLCRSNCWHCCHMGHPGRIQNHWVHARTARWS